jgi:hypothetical protein
MNVETETGQRMLVGIDEALSFPKKMLGFRESKKHALLVMEQQLQRS